MVWLRRALLVAHFIAAIAVLAFLTHNAGSMGLTRGALLSTVALAPVATVVYLLNQSSQS
jgi:hypothetical protein